MSTEPITETFEIPEDDEGLLAECQVWTFHASGPGGQSVNTADSAVRIRHLPTGITVVCRRERSQLLNKRACLERLRAQLEAMLEDAQAPERIATSKPPRIRAGELRAKRAQSRRKVMRRRVEPDEE